MYTRKAHVTREALRRGQGWEKGVVEKNVQDNPRRIWQKACKQRVDSFAELNVWLLAS